MLQGTDGAHVYARSRDAFLIVIFKKHFRFRRVLCVLSGSKLILAHLLCPRTIKPKLVLGTLASRLKNYVLQCRSLSHSH